MNFASASPARAAEKPERQSDADHRGNGFAPCRPLEFPAFAFYPDRLELFPARLKQMAPRLAWIAPRRREERMKKTLWIWGATFAAALACGSRWRAGQTFDRSVRRNGHAASGAAAEIETIASRERLRHWRREDRTGCAHRRLHQPDRLRQMERQGHWLGLRQPLRRLQRARSGRQGAWRLRPGDPARP